MKLLSWNVNGLRAVMKRGFAEFLAAEAPDVLGLQEVRAAATQVDAVWPSEYQVLWNPGCRAGYAGVAAFVRVPPLAAWPGIGEPEGDAEGRVLTLEYPRCFIVIVYTPNSQNELVRLPYRTEVWDPAFRRYCRDLDRRKPVVFCGDLNVAHEDIDIARPQANRRTAGFTDEERRSFTELLDTGFVDSFRHFEPGPGHYTWWSQRSGAREKNIGWRIDYVGVSERLRPALKRAFILPGVLGSDHCPVGIDFDD